MPSAATEKDVVAELLAKLSDLADQAVAEETGPISQKRLELQLTYPPVNREKLMGIFSKSDRFDLRRERAFVYGPTVKEAGRPLLPVVTINANFAASGGSKISVYVMCWIFYQMKWSVLPLRFERPPPNQMDGAHGYNHVQFFWSLFDNGRPLVDGANMEWLPQKQPAIPLPPINDAPSIVAAAIISLYGLIGARPYISDLQGTNFPFALNPQQASEPLSRDRRPKPRRRR